MRSFELVGKLTRQDLDINTLTHSRTRREPYNKTNKIFWLKSRLDRVQTRFYSAVIKTLLTYENLKSHTFSLLQPERHKLYHNATHRV